MMTRRNKRNSKPEFTAHQRAWLKTNGFEIRTWIGRRTFTRDLANGWQMAIVCVGDGTAYVNHWRPSNVYPDPIEWGYKVCDIKGTVRECFLAVLAEVAREARQAAA